MYLPNPKLIIIRGLLTDIMKLDKRRTKFTKNVKNESTNNSKGKA